jgi:murein DD-endopeptidase MepM/ murein hydrolase activator NlpD
LNAYEASKPVSILFGKVISTDPLKIQAGEYLTLGKEFLVVNGSVAQGDEVTLIRCQGGQKYVVLGTRTVYVENTVYAGGGVVDGSGATASGGYQYPFKNGYSITSPYGNRTLNGTTSLHRGLDMVGTGSKQIYPINSGTVVTKSFDSDGYGNYVVINHGNGYWSLYGHMSTVYVQVGQSVNKDTIIGIEGSTGYSTGSHLHLEVRKGANSRDNTIDPKAFLASN